MCVPAALPCSFLWRHLHVLALGQVCLLVVKGLLVAAVVRAYGTPWRTAAAVGISMAHVGEFALVLLSMGWHLGILPAQVGAAGLGQPVVTYVLLRFVAGTGVCKLV